MEGRTDTPCNGWDMPEGCCTFCGDSDPLLMEMWDELVPWAFRETCRRFPGHCNVEVRPCAPCSCPCGSCRCGRPPVIDLTDAFEYSVVSIENVAQLQVVIDNQAQSASEWRLETDDVTFSALGGRQGWPKQNLMLTEGDPGTWSIRATIGENPPAMLLRGLAQFACELVKDCRGQESCLPDGVRSISRRGQHRWTFTGVRAATAVSL